MKRIIKNFFAFVFLFMPLSSIWAVDVTLLIDEGVSRPASLEAAQRHLAQILTEINRAQKAGDEFLNNASFPMDEFSQKALSRLWAVTPFYCDDEEVVERAWVFKDGTMMVQHIPLIITPKGDDAYGLNTYQEAVVEFDRTGKITDFRLAIDAHTSESMEHCGSVVEQERKMIILKYLEQFRTAYNQHDIDYIEQAFSDDALIITGRIVMTRSNGDNPLMTPKVQYNKQNKEQYIRNLRRTFAQNKWINVTFTEIGKGESGDCPGITRSKKNPNMYGVRMVQKWESSKYSDEGYLFLLWEFPEDGSNPLIHVRTWQPSIVAGKHTKANDDISTLAGFDL